MLWVMEMHLSLWRVCMTHPFLEHSCSWFRTLTSQHPVFIYINVNESYESSVYSSQSVQVQLREDHIFTRMFVQSASHFNLYKSLEQMQLMHENNIMFVMINFCKTCQKQDLLRNVPSCWNVLGISHDECRWRMSRSFWNSGISTI